MFGKGRDSIRGTTGVDCGMARMLVILMVIAVVSFAAISVFAETTSEGPLIEKELKEKPPREGLPKDGQPTKEVVLKGDSDRIIASFSPGSGSSYFYYNPPTLVDENIYVGTSRKAKDNPVADNYFFKLDTDLNQIWEYPLHLSEVRGGCFRHNGIA